MRFIFSTLIMLGPLRCFALLDFRVYYDEAFFFFFLVVLFCSEKKKKKESVFLFYIYNFYFKNLIYKLIKKFQNLILSLSTYKLNS